MSVQAKISKNSGLLSVTVKGILGAEGKLRPKGKISRLHLNPPGPWPSGGFFVP
jgi:hypothetical protein